MGNVIEMDFVDGALKITLDFKNPSDAKEFFTNKNCINKVLSIIEEEERESQEEKEINDLFDSLSKDLKKLKENALNALFELIKEERDNRVIRD